MDKIDKVCNEVLKTIKPDDKEQARIISHAESVLKKVAHAAGKDAKAVMGGSIAKGTWLSGSADCDIFVRFDYDKYKGKDISKILSKSLKKVWSSFETLHGSRDYFQKKLKDLVFEVVPVLYVDDPKKAENITDISPLHAEWVSCHPKYADDIRLAKAFAKSIKSYGAESYLRGFSGYVLEILVIYYKGFKRFVKAASKWKEGKIFDINKFHKDVYKEMNESKLMSPIIIVDPVQPGRNAAAALSLEKFNLMVEKAGEFVKLPSKEFFIEKRLSITELKKEAKGKHLVFMYAEPKKGKQDVIGSKLLKAYDHIRKQLIINDFKVFDSGWEWNKKEKSLFWYILDNETVTKYKRWIGPPVNQEQHAKRFKQKHDNVKVEDGKLVANVQRKYTDARSLIRSVSKSAYMKEKVRGIELR